MQLWLGNQCEIQVFITEQLCLVLHSEQGFAFTGKSVLTSWHWSTGLSLCKTPRTGGRSVGCLQWLLQGATYENFWAIQCENLELLLSVKLRFGYCVFIMQALQDLA